MSNHNTASVGMDILRKLDKALDEHGRPNRFFLRELFAGSPMLAGRAMRNETTLLSLPAGCRYVRPTETQPAYIQCDELASTDGEGRGRR